MLHAVISLALLVSAAPQKATQAAHPDVGADNGPDACRTCHADQTPDVVKQWESGPHGLMLVKCFVCHGSHMHDPDRMCNRITIDAVDPISKQPEFKVCAVKIAKVGEA